MLTFYYAMAIEVFSFIFALIIVSRAWRVLQGLPGVRTEPDLAAWNLLIPVYNIYWSFVAWHVWVSDYQRYRLTLKNPRVPKVGDNVFLVPLVMYYACLALLLLIYLLSLQLLILLVLLNIILIACAVLWWMAVYQMCQATNFLAELQRMSPGRE